MWLILRGGVGVVKAPEGYLIDGVSIVADPRVFIANDYFLGLSGI